jgi:carnitine O-acetyltransferase
MFDCSRVPAIPSDYSVTYAKNGSSGDEGHIIVFRRNRPWKIECFDNGRLLSTAELERSVALHVTAERALMRDDYRQFQYIYDNTSKEYPGVGVLTASNRDVWTKARLFSLCHHLQ